MKNLIRITNTKFVIFLQILTILNLFSLFSNKEINTETQTTKKGVSNIDIFDKIIAHKINTKSELEKLLNESDLTFLAFYYKKNSENSRKVAEFLVNISEKLNYLSGIILIDCDKVDKNYFVRCSSEVEKETEDLFPIVNLYIPPELKFNPYTKKFNSHLERNYEKKEYSENFIYNFITSNILNKGIKLNSDNLENFLGNNDYNKLILFTNKKQTPLIFRGLSNYFLNQLLFGEVEKEQVDLIKRFDIKTFPTLMIYKTQEDQDDILDEPKIEIYKGKIVSAEIVQFLSDYALRQKKYLEINENPQISSQINYLNVIRNLSKDQLPQFFEKNKEKKIILFLSKDSINIPEYLQKFYFDTNSFFYFIRYNCEEDPEFCKSTFRVKHIPSLLFIDARKSEEKKDFHKIFENAENFNLDYNDIQNDILRNFPSEISFINHQTFQNSISSTVNSGKIPIIYLYNNEIIPLGLHLLTIDPRIKERMQIYAFENPPKEIIKNFQVNKLPELILLFNDPDNFGTARLMKYNHELTFQKLKKFFTVNVKFSNKPVDKNNSLDPNINSNREILFFKDNNFLQKNCVKSSKKLCLFGFLDGRKNEESKKSYDSSFKIYQEVLEKNTNKPYNFGWVNSTCQENFSSVFNINSGSLPNLIAYIPSRDVYASLLGSFETENIDSFLDTVIRGKANFYKIQKEKVVLEDIKCEEIQEIQENLEEDEILKEILEEERKKREELEKQRKLDEPNTKGKKKKKKKKKDL